MTLKEQDQKEIMEKLIVLTDEDKLKWESNMSVEDQGNGNYTMQQYFKAEQMIKNRDTILFFLDLSTKELEITRRCYRTIATITVTQDLINSVLSNNEKQREQAYKEDIEQIKSILDEIESEEQE